MSSDTLHPPRHWVLPAAVAAVALAAVLSTLDSSGAVSHTGAGPGLTLDETFNVQMGVYHVRALREYGLALLHPDSIREIFSDPAYNPDHPPLGRLLIGLAHEATFAWFDPDVPRGAVCVTCGRVASALAFAVTVFLVGWTASRWHGLAAGVVAATSVVLMPRLFAHAHLASLETFVNLGYLACVIWIADHWSGDRPPSWSAVLVAGLLFGLCLLTKIQGVLLPVTIGLWTLCRWRLRGVLPCLLFGLTGLFVFFAGWPWLWLDPVGHLAEYLGRTTDRQTLYCWYMNAKWADTEVPWHYALVLFLSTVPAGLHLLGALGCWSLLRRIGASTETSPVAVTGLRPSVFVALNVVWPLMFFALPGITVYDGTRLFLMVFPLWALLIARGSRVLYEVVTAHWGRRVGQLGLVLLLGSQAFGVVAGHPVQLSYYNLLVGGLRGATRLGFETTYWGDSVTPALLADAAATIPEHAVLHVAPVLHPFQLQELETQSPLLRARGIRLAAYDDAVADDVAYVLVFRRRADSWPLLTPAPPGRLLAEVAWNGVQLAAVYQLKGI